MDGKSASSSRSKPKSDPRGHMKKKNKLRTSKDIYNRLKWDWKGLGIDLSSVYIGYKDRFLGMCELTYSDFHPGSEDERDIPFHRIYYFRGGGAPVFPILGEKGEVQVREHNWPRGTIMYWDRESRVDLIFKSGEGQGHGHHGTAANLPTVFKKTPIPPDGYKIKPSYKYCQNSACWVETNDEDDERETTDLKFLTILSFNILYGLYDEDVVQCARRWPYLIDFLEDSNADIIALQEVTPDFLMLLESQPFVRDKYYLTEISLNGNGYASESMSSTVIPYGQLFLSKIPPEQIFVKREMNKGASGKESEFGKMFLIANFCLPNGKDLYVANIHLSSDYRKERSALRQVQIKNLIQTMFKLPNASGSDLLIVGDTNCGNHEHIIQNPMLIDAWQYLGYEDPGYTCDSTMNGLTQANSRKFTQKRFDRIFFKASDGFVGIEPIQMKILGKESIDFKKEPRAVVNVEVKGQLPLGQNLWLSDHYALKCEFKIPEVIDVVDVPELLEPSYNYNVAYTSALVIMPPRDLWAQIQNIRSEFDPAFLRWPPHINLLFPFVENRDVNFETAEEAFTKILKDFPSFQVTLSEIGVFQHSKTCTVYLKAAETEISIISALQNILFGEFQNVFKIKLESKSRFIPHLTIAKLPTGSVLERQKCKELIEIWTQNFAAEGLEFIVDSIQLLSRTTDSPFEVRNTVKLIPAVFNSMHDNNDSWNDYNSTCHLNNFLNQNGLLPTSEERRIKRMEIMQEIETVCASVLSMEGFGKCTHFIGSTAMNFHDDSSDLDILCCGPPSMSQDEFFTRLDGFDLQPFNLRLHSVVRSAIVPVARLTAETTTPGFAIDIDLTYCRLPLDIPPLFVPEALLTMMTDADLRSLDGIRVVKKIQEVIPPKNQLDYQTSVRALKYWAKQRNVYSKAFGFIGSLQISIMAARTILDMLDSGKENFSPENVVMHFFEIFSKWHWPKPISLSSKDMASAGKGRIPELMPILSPAFPHLNTVRGVTRSTICIMKKEFERGHQIFSNGSDRDFEANWKEATEDQNFLEEYPEYLHVSVSFKDERDMEAGVGIMSSKLISLVVQLERLNNSAIVQPNPNVLKSTRHGSGESHYISAVVFGLHGFDRESVSEYNFDKTIREQNGKLQTWLTSSCQHPVQIQIDVVKSGSPVIATFLF